VLTPRSDGVPVLLPTYPWWCLYRKEGLSLFLSQPCGS